MPTMTLEKAYSVLGVSNGAPFERVVEAKNAKLSRVAQDADKLMEIETAYDLLFMQHMRKRLTGELEVSTSVRYADVPAAGPKRGSTSAAAGRAGATSSAPAPPAVRAPSLPAINTSALNLKISAPRGQLLTTQSVGFVALALWTGVGAVLETPEAQLQETAGTQIAFTLALSIWSLTQKRMQLGKAVGVTMGCFVIGAMLGSLLNSWLRVDIVPLGSFSSPGALVAESIIAACAAGAIFLI